MTRYGGKATCRILNRAFASPYHKRLLTVPQKVL
nr:MAG TPA: hypothetical protein [Caudoviricetes sp.]